MSQAVETDAPRVTDAIFLPGPGGRGTMSIFVQGEGFVKRAQPLLARLGQQMVARVVVLADGRGFAGLLQRAPREGDRLFVGYADRDLVETSVVYRGGAPSAPRVA